MNTDEKIDLILNKLDSMDNRMGSMESRMDSMESHMGSMESRMNSMESRMDSMEGDIATIKSDVLDMKLQIENELIRDIQRVAEGHLDLERHLKDAERVNSEYEMLVLRVNHLETVVERLEKKIS